MTEPKHTPGPWKIEYRESQGTGEPGYWIIRAAYGPITSIGEASQRGPIDRESNKGNVSLISAAPDLYPALAAAMPLLEVNARIARELAGANEHGPALARNIESIVVAARAALAKARGET